MAIIFGGEAGIVTNSFSGFITEISNSFSKFTDTLNNSIQDKGPPAPPVESVFVESGFQDIPGTSFVESTVDSVDDIKKRRTTTQEPSLTVYIKKRAFWSLQDENSSKFMDDGEKLFIRASKILFEKKCTQIASYELLTKMSKLVSEDAHLDANRIDAFIDVMEKFVDDNINDLEESANLALQTDPTNTVFNERVIFQLNRLKEDSENTRSIINGLRKVSRRQGKLTQATNTNWVIDPDQPDIFNVGRGSGVIELTIVSNISTSLGIEGTGKVNFSIPDPYNLTKITSDDVEIALASAFKEHQKIKSKDYDLIGPSTILDLAKSKEEELRVLRENKVAEAFGFSRTAIGGAAAAEIIFEINASSYAKEKVVAYTTSTSVPPFNKDSFRVAMLQLPVEQQLTPTEDNLVTEIFDLLGEYVVAIERINSETIEKNQDQNVVYARRNLRMHYLGKSIIQPMDSVHVFIRGNTTKHGQVIGPLSGILNGTTFVQDAARDEGISDAMIIEEMKMFDLDKLGIPPEFYKAIRTGSFMRNAGIHVFGGLVKAVSESFSANSGTHTLSIDGESNLRWLNLSRVNVKPSLEQPQGLLEDPLTPFRYDIDAGTGLIKGKPELLPVNAQRIKNQMLVDKDGTHAGKPVDQKTLEQDYIPTEDDLQIIWKHVPGMVYKWKRGVMVSTLDVNMKTSLQGSDEDKKHLQRFVGLNIVEQPFASMDAADIVSLLVTGYPHSVEKFYENTKGIGTFRSSGDNASPSYFHSFFDITRSTNKALGNFRPYRAVNLDGSALAARLKLQASLKGSFKTLDGLRSDLAKARDKKIAITKHQEPNATKTELDTQRDLAIRGLDDVIKALKSKVLNEKERITAARSDAEKNGVIPKESGNIVFRLDELPSGLETDAQEQTQKEVRLRNKILQLRTQFDCKFNTDENLLIIADEYDNDVDIQAYILGSLGQAQNLFNSEYKYPIEICKEVSKTLEFEFFCNTQGHVEFRPPQYNRVPLSLILKMFLLNKNNGTRLYPDFLTSLFETRRDSIENEDAILDLQIETHTILLGIKEKPKDLVNIVTSGLQDEEIVGNQFIDSADEQLRDSDIKGLAKALVSIRNKIKGEIGYESRLSDVEEAEKEITRFNDPKNPQINSLRLQLTNKLAQLVSKKQKLATTLRKLEEQGDRFDFGIGQFSKEKLNDLLAPFQNLIQDDYNDFLGPGSSKRFIIYDDQIINSSFTESDETAFCRADVNGEVDLLGDGPGKLGVEKALWAGVTDFDIWRQYGYKPLGVFNKPFLKDAKSQCAPFALFLLARARRDIVRGRVVLYGNEYYQLGDVVYINSRSMLYYVHDVKHDFSYDGGSFKTTLELRYGHPLGEYIPTPLDAIGKSIITNQMEFNKVLVSRETSSRKTGVHLGLVKFKEEAAADEKEELKEMLREPFARFNVTELKRSLLVARNHVDSKDENVFPKVEIRGWYKDESNIPKVKNRIKAVIQWLKAPRGRRVDSEERDIEIAEQYYDASLESSEIYNEVVKDTSEPVDPIPLGTGDCGGLQGANLARNRVPGEEVFNSDENGEPYNTIEIVLLFE